MKYALYVFTVHFISVYSYTVGMCGDGANDCEVTFMLLFVKNFIC